MRPTYIFPNKTAMIRGSVAHAHPLGVRSLSLPTHEVVPMPALSPTMEAGTIASWLVKEGEAFSAGQAICEVETDKATVTFDAQDEGYLAKILVGGGEIKVGEPLMVTVEEEGDVGAFSDFAIEASPAGALATPAPSPAPAPTPTPTNTTISTPTSLSAIPLTSSAPVAAGGRVFASPLARKLARDAGIDLTVAGIAPSGPKGRIIAADVMAALASGTSGAITMGGGVVSDTGVGVEVLTHERPSIADPAERATLLTRTKLEVPHYYLSVEINLTALLAMRDSLNSSISKGDEQPLAVSDFIIKAAAGAMRTVPDCNGEWNDSFVRQYDQVDINIVMGSGDNMLAPVLKDVGSMGLGQISQATADFEDKIFSDDDEVIDVNALSQGTFTIHNLGKNKLKT